MVDVTMEEGSGKIENSYAAFSVNGASFFLN